MIHHDSQDLGVSPVVGVMLMLVLVILLVSVFAVAVTMVFLPKDNPVDAKIMYLNTDSNDHYVFEIVGGKPFLKSKLKVVLRLRDNPAFFVERRDSEITATHDTSVMTGDRIILGMPDRTTEFDTRNQYVIWMFYDTDAGALISSGEIYDTG